MGRVGKQSLAPARAPTEFTHLGKRARVQPGTWVTGLTGDMGNSFLVSFMVVGPVGLWASRQGRPHVHRSVACVWSAVRRDDR